MDQIKNKVIEYNKALSESKSDNTFHQILSNLNAWYRGLRPNESKVADSVTLCFNKIDYKFRISPDEILIKSVFKFENCQFFEPVNIRFPNSTFLNCNFTNLFLEASLDSFKCSGEKIDTLNLSTNQEPEGGYYFSKLNINKLKINGELYNVYFRECSFKDEVIAEYSQRPYKKVYFEKCEFYAAPDFLEASFSKAVGLDGNRFNKLDRHSMRCYQDLKHKFSENHDDAGVATFGAMELKCKHTFSEANLIERVCSNGYKFISDFGLDPFRPGLFLFIQFISSIFIFMTITSTLGLFAAKNKDLILNTELLQSLYLSLVTTLGPFRILGDFNLLEVVTPMPQIVMFLLSALSSLLWFMLILAIRRRFKVQSE